MAAEDSGRSFFVRYLGCNRFQSRAKQRGLKALQRPLLDLYSAARRKGEDQRSVHPLALTQRLDVSHYGLVVAEALEDPETGRAVTAVTRVITPAANVVLWAALRFSARLAKRRSIGAAFVPLACSEDVVDRSWYCGLPTKRRFLVGLAHPPVFACLFRQVAAPSTWECHAFLCASAEDALLICSSLGEARDTVVVVDRPRPTAIVGKRSDDYSDLTSCTSSYTMRHFNGRKLSPSIDDPQSSATASASGYYQEIDRRVKPPRRTLKKPSQRTDTESKSSASEERKRRVRRKSSSHKYRDLSGKFAGSAASRTIPSEFSYSSNGNTTIRAEDVTAKDVVLQTSSHKDGLIFQNVVKAGDRKSSDESTSSTQTPTNDTGYFSSKSKSAKASKEDLSQKDESDKAPPKPPQSTYYFGQNIAPTSSSFLHKTDLTSYTYFLNGRKKVPVEEPLITPEEVKPHRNLNGVTISGHSDSSLSGYHSDSCCQTREAGTMTKACGDSDCCCSCDFSSACSECSSSRQTLVPSSRQSRGQMTMSETMNLSSECESDAPWMRRGSTTCSSSVHRVRGRSEHHRGEVVTRAQVHHHQHTGRRRDPLRATKNACTSTTSSLRGSSSEGSPDGKVVIDVVQYDGTSRGMLTTPGVITFNKHGHVRDWASLSNYSGSSRVPSSIQPAPPRRTTKVIRWDQQQLPKRKPGFLSNLKKLSLSSLTRARAKTSKLLSRMRTRRKEQVDPEPTPEVCLSPDGNIRPKRKKRRRLSWSFHDLRSAFPSRSGVVYVGAPQRPRRRKKGSPSDASDLGPEECSMSPEPCVPQRQRRKSDSEISHHIAGDVTTIRVEHGLTKDGFKRWSNTNLHSELGYIP